MVNNGKAYKFKKMTEKMIRDAYCRIRTIDNSIPNDVLDFMKESALEEYRQWLEQQIERCLNDKDLQREHWAFCKAYEKFTALRQPPVSGSLPPDELEKSLGSTNRQFTIWHDGGEWLISLKGKEQEQCKALREWLGGNDR